MYNLVKFRDQQVTDHRDHQVSTAELFDQDLEHGFFPSVLLDLVLGFHASDEPNPVASCAIAAADCGLQGGGQPTPRWRSTCPVCESILISKKVPLSTLAYMKMPSKKPLRSRPGVRMHTMRLPQLQERPPP